MSRTGILVGLLLFGCAGSEPAPQSSAPLILHASADFTIGETLDVTLVDGSKTKATLQDLKETLDDVNGAVRHAEVTIEVNGEKATIASGNYRLPALVGGVQVDCPVTRGYKAKGNSKMVWGLIKDARLRFWPKDSPWITPGTFGYPARQRWFATMTQLGNEPVYVDGGDFPLKKEIYYHYGNDIGGSEGLTDVVAATDGLVVSSGTQVLDGPGREKPVASRYDVVYLKDDRGWYYRYSHLKFIQPEIRAGVRVKKGHKLGVLGKEGGSGGWTHLHFDITRKQPSGLWGIEEGYAFLWQASMEEHPRDLTAVARPHALIWAGQKAVLDARNSRGKGLQYQWTFTEGGQSSEPRVERVYDKPGVYAETLRITDAEGRIDYDFMIVQVCDKATPDKPPPTVHATFAPTYGIRPLDPIVFKVRTFRDTEGGETWNFGDGSKPVTVKSDGNKDHHAATGYAETIHKYEKPGQYLVSVEHTSASGVRAVARLLVRVGTE